MLDADGHFKDVEIARMLGVNPVTVRQWRVKNKKAGCVKYGPPYEIHGGEVIYPKHAFRAWCSQVKTVNGVPQLNLPTSADQAAIDRATRDATQAATPRSH